MRFLQTSDWHLGKIFHEKNLIEDQQIILDQIIGQIKKAEEEKNPYSALLVPGDIYDRAVPSQEATELLSSFIARMNSEHPSVHMFFLSGNHDSSSRLSYGAKIFEKQNIHFCTNTKNLSEPVILSNDKEKVAVYQIPFLSPLSIESTDDKPLRQQQELYEAACSKILEGHKKNYSEIPAVVCAHLYSIGTKLAASERSYVGTAEQVNVSVFNGFTYGALGHIHRFQYCNKNHTIAYSGSPLPYNFDDSPETFMLDVNICAETKTAEAVKIPFKALHPIIKLEGKLAEFLNERADEIKKYKDYYIEVTLTDDVIQPGAYTILQSIMPNLLSLILKGSKAQENSGSLQQRKEAMESRDPVKIFNQFLSDIYSDEELEKEVVTLEKKLFIKEAKAVEKGAE